MSPASDDTNDTNPDQSRMPYQLPFPVEAQTEIVQTPVVPTDERVWVPQMENVWFRPLCLNASQGYWVNLLRVRRSGETHTLVVPNDVQEMITLFHITGCMIYVDPRGKQTGYEDVFTKITMCRQHYGENGLGAKFVEQFIR